jgi:glycosyltransferase involved in cell wall biosynthesis
MRVAFVGTRGVPARYGGFETAVEEIGRRLAARGHEVLVYCRGAQEQSERHLGMRCVHLPALSSRTLETLSHTALSSADLLTRRTVDCALVFNAANAPFLPVLRARRLPVATHVDGLEWQRAKWGPQGRRYYRAAEAMAVRWSDALIADAEGIADYYRQVFRAPTRMIPYGAPVVRPGADLLAEVGLAPGGYHLVVARMEPENHVALMVEGYLRAGARLPLVVVGSVPYPSDYSREVHRLAATSPAVRMLGGVWDQDLLDQLYAGSATYLHGHSVGGTNPSLLRALGAAAPVVAYDVVFNREVAGPCAGYVTTADDVARAVLQHERDPGAARVRGTAGRRRVARRYDWDRVADGYEELCTDLVQGPRPARLRPSGRRYAEWVPPVVAPVVGPDEARGEVLDEVLDLRDVRPERVVDRAG